MKRKILKFLIKKNGYYDYDRFLLLVDRSLTSIFVCWLYRKFLIAFCRKKQPKKQKNFVEIIGELMGNFKKRD
jgi:hypothetical protein